MTKESTHIISQRLKAVSDAVAARRLRDAFIWLRKHAASLGDWKITDRIDNLEQSYSMMLDYAVSGQPDPNRQELYDSIIADMFKLADTISYRLNLDNAPELFYSTLRYERLQSNDTLESLLEEYIKLVQKNSIYNMLTSAPGNDTAVDNATAADAVAKRVFNRVWTTFPVSDDEAKALQKIFEAASPFPMYFQLLMVSAVSLSLVHFYDQTKVDILFNIYQSSESPQLAVQALCGALIGMCLHRDRFNKTLMKHRIESLRETTSWKSDVRMIAMQLIRTRDTERIHRKLTDEIMPQMLKLRPDIARRLSDTASFTEIPSIEENPEWEEILEKAGITDSLKELMQLQEEGGDVMLATFANLKSFPFFNDVSNWFMPFRTDSPAIGNDLEVKKLAKMLEAMNMFCDGDKYSFILMLSGMPEAQRKMMTVQLDQQQMAAMELQNASIQTDVVFRQHVANRYVQQLYRFFKLFRRRGEFNDPFARPLNLAAMDVLSADLSDVDNLKLVAEFYFKRGYYADALDIFQQLAAKNNIDNASLQKMGVCQQKLGFTDKALQTYLKAELMHPDSVWTLRRIAACYRATGNTSKALEYYRRIEESRTDDIELALSIGHCLLELEDYENALKYYFKVEYLSPESHKALRPIAWCSFVMGQFDQSRKYFDRILLNNPSSTDYMNMGHLHMALNDIREALNYYSLAMSQDGVEQEQFIADLRSDYVWLERSGVDLNVMPLVIDALMYKKNR